LDDSASVSRLGELSGGFDEGNRILPSRLHREEPEQARSSLPDTGERLVPGTIGGQLFRQHEVRYVFAGAFVKNQRVLDVASGSGIGTHYLFGVGAERCIGLDIDKAATQYARTTYGDCVFAQCEAARLCLSEGSIDTIVSFETIEHIKDQKAFLIECRRVLRPGGIFVCSTPNRTLSRWGDDNPFHLRELTVAQFRELVASVFVDVQLHGQSNSFYPLYVGRIILARLLNKLQLVGPIMRFLRRNPSTAAPTTEFKGNFGDLREIRPLETTLLRQPMFVIAVARKAKGSRLDL
jgi:SAM-dependent methyltransferase